MDKKLRELLINTALRYVSKNDVSHDMLHAKRVLINVEAIGPKEKADMDVLVPAALFHDLIVSSKKSPKAKTDAHRSAPLARKILNKLGYGKGKIDKVCYAIETCSFSKGIIPDTLEAKILQDADRLEATGAIGIMRTFGSAGSMKVPFYDETDIFAESRKPGDVCAFDLFYKRLLIVKDTMYTKTAKTIAERRTKFLYDFINEFKKELEEV